MQPLMTYEYLSKARARLLDWVRPLSSEQYLQVFPIGLGTLGRTLTHIMICEYAYVRRIAQQSVPPYGEWPIQDEKPPAFGVLEAAWLEQAKLTRATLAAVQDWTSEIEYQVGEEGKRVNITASRGEIFTQLAFHEVHHRAQAMNMLRRLGVAAEDLDYNTLMYRRRPVS